MTQTTEDMADIDPDRVFKDLAMQHGLLSSDSDSVGDELWSYTMAVVALCARIADAHDEVDEVGPAGESIRAALLDYRVR